MNSFPRLIFSFAATNLRCLCRAESHHLTTELCCLRRAVLAILVGSSTRVISLYRPFMPPGRGRTTTRLARLKGDAHFDILVQLAENADQPIQCEATKLRIADAGRTPNGDAGQAFGAAQRKPAFVRMRMILAAVTARACARPASGRPKSR